MDTIITAIAKSRIEKDLNEGFKEIGLFVSGIEFNDGDDDSDTDFSILLKMSLCDEKISCAYE